MNLINHASAPIRKETLSPTNNARREDSRNKFMKKGEMPDRVKAFENLIVARVVEEPDLGLLNPYEMV